MLSMLVAMIKLRMKGQKLDAAGVRRQQRYFGRLRVTSEPEARHAVKSQRAAMLLPPGEGLTPLAELHAVRIHLVDARGMVLQGVEEHWNRKIRTDHPQAWWCWPITEGELSRALAPDPVDVDEEREQIEAAVLAG